MNITDISSLPIDSLYKFLSISGLLMLVLSFYVPMVFVRNLRVKTIDIQADIDLSKLKIEQGKKRMQSAQDRLGPEYAKILNMHMESEDCSEEKLRSVLRDCELDISDDDIANMLKAIEYNSKLLDELYVDQIRRTCEAKKLDLAMNEVRSILALKWIGIVFGFVLLVLGFYNWYSKQQVYVDRAYENYCISIDQKES